MQGRDFQLNPLRARDRSNRSDRTSFHYLDYSETEKNCTTHEANVIDLICVIRIY